MFQGNQQSQCTLYQQGRYLHSLLSDQCHGRSACRQEHLLALRLAMSPAFRKCSYAALHQAV